MKSPRNPEGDMYTWTQVLLQSNGIFSVKTTNRKLTVVPEEKSQLWSEWRTSSGNHECLHQILWKSNFFDNAIFYGYAKTWKVVIGEKSVGFMLNKIDILVQTRGTPTD